MEELKAIDFYRMFFGSNISPIFLIEISIRTSVMFIWTLINIRFLGKRNISKISPFEFFIAFALGSAAGDPMFYPEVPVLHGMIVITTIVLLERIHSYLNRKSILAEKFIEGETNLVISEGKILNKSLEKEKMTKNELMTRLRQQGIENTGQIKYAFLETSGELSIIEYKESEIKKGESTIKILKKTSKSATI